MMDTLPQELIDKIIASFDCDSPEGFLALHACARVCRSWQRQAQKELFFEVHLMKPAHLIKWASINPLESEIPSYVRQLYWMASLKQNPRRLSDPFLENAFPGRFASFSNIESLWVFTLSLCILDNATIEHAFLPLAHSLRALRIRNLTTDPEKWCFLISLLPNLRTIELFAVTMLKREEKSSSDRPLSFNFTGHLFSYHAKTEQFFRWVADIGPPIESLHAYHFNHTLAGTFNLVMQSCSATLTEISFTSLTPKIGGEPSRSGLSIANLIRSVVKATSQLDLSWCDNLRTLKADQTLASSPEFNAILQTVSSKNFEKLVISLGVNGIRGVFNANDQAFYSFAKRLYKLGARDPLAIVIEFPRGTQRRYNVLDAHCVLPWFSEVGVVVKERVGLYPPIESSSWI
jgi:hypothetical protein